jgi:prepilin-type N-terminal cleavage/methylation domain-containing protein
MASYERNVQQWSFERRGCGPRGRAPLHARARALPGTCRAFTLLEMLVVITIIGLLSTIGLVAVKGMTKSNTMMAANRQLLDDFSYARQRAISDHTTVYVVFIPPYIVNQTTYPLTGNTAIDNAITNLYTAQCTTYAMLSLRSVGDQPGTTSPHYLTAWRTLPNGVYIATNKFSMVGNYAPMFTNDVPFPFPFATNNAAYYLPYLSFNYLGQLVDSSGNLLNSSQHEFIQLVRGGVYYSAGNPPPAEYLETPKGNGYYAGYNTTPALNNQVLPGAEAYDEIRIDPLTGKARVLHQDVQ